jgi:hypothetical protein
MDKTQFICGQSSLILIGQDPGAADIPFSFAYDEDDNSAQRSMQQEKIHQAFSYFPAPKSQFIKAKS